ncbi:GFA family protein [Arenicella xantha]|uniref:CENP-V/GFA domain-containing protein n=1 Tax=Arenicella xantha TaxID=644221 RepID=A0A395JMS5_9GAMM|nr:GFA family protein [Arenicella xantha]RBP52849.1 hypothetical protein DFR28_101233 [Arenicella xantha]
MSEKFTAHGKCLCGAVTFTAAAVVKEIGACHCSMCRTWSGGPFLGLDCGTQVTFIGDVSSFSSSDWAERGFCPHCGTHLFYKLIGNQTFIMPVGLFDAQTDLVFDHQIFIDEKPSYYSFKQTTPTMTGAEVFAALAPKE